MGYFKAAQHLGAYYINGHHRLRGHLKKNANQAVVVKGKVHFRSRRRIRGKDGGRAGGITSAYDPSPSVVCIRMKRKKAQ